MRRRGYGLTAEGGGYCGLLFGEIVCVAVGVPVCVGVWVAVGVDVGVGVAVCVGVGVAVTTVPTVAALHVTLTGLIGNARVL